MKSIKIRNQAIFKRLRVALLERIINFATARIIGMNLIERNIKKIADLCRRHKVKKLCVFGSILTDRFNEESDVDLLVDFESLDPGKFDYVTNYFDFRDSLESLFQRKVDLIEEKGLRNKYFIANLSRTKVIIYG